MDEKMNMILNESLILWAFGCAVNHEDMAALMISAAALVCMLFCYPAQAFRKRLLPSLLYADFFLILSHLCGISTIIPAVGAVIAVNSIYAVMTYENSVRLMDRAAGILLRIFLLFAAMAMIMPSDQFSFLQLAVLIVTIFAPILIVYVLRTVNDLAKCEYHGSTVSNEIK